MNQEVRTVNDLMMCDLELESGLRRRNSFPTARKRTASASDVTVKSFRAYLSRNRALSAKKYTPKPHSMSDQYPFAYQSKSKSDATQKKTPCVAGPGFLLKALLAAGNEWNENFRDPDALPNTASEDQALSSCPLNSAAEVKLVPCAPSTPSTCRPNSSIRAKYRACH
mmetsp:Transcript_86927/g.137173  ORF Transcript_86927/g.137173 Transcript_86927/m.137173 type:complete len:168 (-) Transcript_86927:737-1240(-)